MLCRRSRHQPGPLSMVLALGCSLLMLFQATAASATENCKLLAGKTIRWIVPTKPGGGYDAYSRLIQPFLERQLDAQIIIENRSEAGGIVGAIAIRDALPDGTTMGIINASGLLAANMTSAGPAPDPASDFTIIGRLVSNQMVLLTGADSGINNIHDVLRISASRSLLVGVRDAGSVSFIAIPISAALLGLNYTVVTGYVGSSARALALIRGEIDLIIQNYDSIRRYVNDGELIPLLQINPRASAANDSRQDELEDLPTLATLAERQFGTAGLEPADARRKANALSSIIGAGRLVVAPPSLSEPMTNCLVASLSTVLDSQPLLDAAMRLGLGLSPAGPREALQDLIKGESEMAQFVPLVQAAIDQARQ